MVIMMDLVKKTVLAGIGLAAVTKEKVIESLDEWVEKGRLTKDEAIAISEKIVEEGCAEGVKAKLEMNQFFKEMLHRANVVTQEEHQALVERMTALEARLEKVLSEKN